jgi:hypothetical protein
VDFLVISDGQAELDAPRPIDVDLRIFHRCEVEQRLGEGNDLLGWAMHFGRTVFDRDQYWATIRSEWAGKVPSPSPAACFARALRFEGFARELLATGDRDAALEQVIGMLTHRGRATLLEARIYPASRPELPAQLRKIGRHHLADSLECVLRRRRIGTRVLEDIIARLSLSPA